MTLVISIGGLGTRALNGVLLCPISDFATRRCSGNGLWLDDVGKEGPDPSWTNFSACFTPELTKVIEGFYANISGTSEVPSINYICSEWKGGWKNSPFMQLNNAKLKVA